jgi:hypothetical protein
MIGVQGCLCRVRTIKQRASQYISVLERGEDAPQPNTFALAWLFVGGLLRRSSSQVSLLLPLIVTHCSTQQSRGDSQDSS